MMHTREIMGVILILLSLMVACATEEPARELVADDNFPLQFAWTIDYDREIRSQPQAVMNSELWFVHSSEGKLLAINKQTGDIEWTFAFANNPLFPKALSYILEQDVIILIYDGTLYQLDAEDGSIIWEKSLKLDGRDSSSAVWQQERDLSFAFAPSIVVMEDVITITGMLEGGAGYTVGLDITTSERIWQQDLPHRTSPEAFDCSAIELEANKANHVICLVINGSLRLLDPQTGAIQVTRLVLPYSWHTPFVVDGSIVMAAAPEPYVAIFNPTTAEVVRTFASCALSRGPIPQVTESHISIATGCNDVYQLNLGEWDKEPKWVYKSSDDVKSSLATIDDLHGFFLTASGDIIAISLSDGQLLGEFNIYSEEIKYPPEYMNGLYPSDGRLYALVEGKHLYAFEPRSVE